MFFGWPLVFPLPDRFIVRPFPFLLVSFSVLGVGFANVGVMLLDGLIAGLVAMIEDGSAMGGFEAEAVTGQVVDCGVSKSEVDLLDSEPKKAPGQWVENGEMRCVGRVVRGDIDDEVPSGEVSSSVSCSSSPTIKEFSFIMSCLERN